MIEREEVTLCPREESRQRLDVSFDRERKRPSGGCLKIRDGAELQALTGDDLVSLFQQFRINQIYSDIRAESEGGVLSRWMEEAGVRMRFMPDSLADDGYPRGLHIKILPAALYISQAELREAYQDMRAAAENLGLNPEEYFLPPELERELRGIPE